MTTWSSLSEINSTLALGADPSSTGSVRDALRRELARIHPDRNAGRFLSQSDEERFHELNSALEFCNRPISASLVPLQDIPAIVAAFRQAWAPEATAATPAQQRAEFREVARRDVHQQVMLPRVGSGIFAGVCGASLTFAGKLPDDTVFGPIFGTVFGRELLLILFLCSGLLFLWTWWSEQRQNASLEWLATDEGRRHVLWRTFRRPREGDGNAIRFSYADMIDAIRGGRQSLPLLFLLPRGVSPAAAERLANLHIDELERRGVIKKVAGPLLDPEYEIERAVLQQLAPRVAGRLSDRDR